MNQRHDNRIRTLALIVGVAAYSTLAGCYTVLKHPATAEVVDGGEARRDCYSCHGPGGNALAYDPLYTPGFDYYPDSWYGFYAYPWWYREFWHDDIYDHGSNVGSGGGPGLWDDDPARRRLWGRGSEEYMPPQLPPIIATPPVQAAPGSPAATPPPASNGGQQPGRSMKGGDDGGKPIPNPTPGPTPPPTPTPTPAPTPERERKDEPAKKTPPPKDRDRKDDGSGS
jgi:hypothetical protein